MSKKILLVLVLLFSVFSIILIAVWGTLPENPNNIEVESLVIEDYDETNDDGDKFKNVIDIVNQQNNIYVIEYLINPGNANKDIVASASTTGVSLQVDLIDNKVYVIFSLEAINQKRTVTILIRDKLTLKYDEITLWFKTPGVIVVPDL